MRVSDAEAYVSRELAITVKVFELFVRPSTLCFPAGLKARAACLPSAAALRRNGGGSMAHNCRTLCEPPVCVASTHRRANREKGGGQKSNQPPEKNETDDSNHSPCLPTCLSVSLSLQLKRCRSTFCFFSTCAVEKKRSLAAILRYSRG